MKRPSRKKIWVNKKRWIEGMEEARAKLPQPSLRHRERDRSGWDAHRIAVWGLLSNTKQLMKVLELWGERLSKNERKIIGAFAQAGTFHRADKILKRKRPQYQPIREAVSRLVVLASGLMPARGYRAAVRRFNVSNAGLPWDDDDDWGV